MARMLTNEEEKFCVHYVSEMPEEEAYRLAYSATHNSVRKSAQRLMKKPMVVARIRELRDRSAKIACYGRAEFINTLRNILENDNNEFSSVEHVNCRYCRGNKHKYQWINTEEFEGEIRRVEAKNFIRSIKTNKEAPLPLPSDSGGYGFNEFEMPVDTCPKCSGRGIVRDIFKDTRNLSKTGKLMYQGIKKTRDGIEIKTINKEVALNLLGKALLGPDNTTNININPHHTVMKDINLPTDDRDASRVYQSIMQGRLIA